MVTRQNEYHGPQFRATRGTTQGGIALPEISNVAVDSVVRHCLSLMVYDGAVIQDGLGHAVGIYPRGFLR